ncbi:pilus assembly protein PilM, partial [Candidatus Uhrbacteria bacterium]|nr:pilus assembly protein PilM [Candidatus Uhrbacteria bacterium]
MSWKKDEGVIGLDLSDNSVEAVQLKSYGSNFELIGWSRAILPAGLIKRGKIIQREKLTDFLKDFFTGAQHGQFKGNKVAVNVPEERVLTHVFQYSPPPKDAEAAVTNDIKAFIPLALDKLAWDWQSKHKDVFKQQIFWAGVPVEYVQERQDVLTRLGMEVAVLDLESAALARSTIKEVAVDEGILLLDMGGETTIIAIYDELGIRCTFNVESGGQIFTRELAEKLKLDLKTAEIKKREVGVNLADGHNQVASILQAMVQPIAEEARRSISYYQSQNTSKKVKKAVLTGGSSLIPGIDHYLCQLLQLEVVKGQV